MRPIALLMLCSAATAVAQRIQPPSQLHPVVTSHSRIARAVSVNLTDVTVAEAITAIADSSGLRVAYSRGMIPLTTARTSVHVRNASVDDALAVALRRTGIMGQVSADGETIIIGPASGGTRSVRLQGIIVGTVTDVKTKRPINGASVSVDGATRGVLTGDDGAYRIAGVSAGAHSLSVKHLGYGRQARTVTVTDAQTTTIDIALEPSANTLDQVVVTGTVIPTELKAIPNAMTVITAKQIEERGITRIDQLFRGDVPGMFTGNQGSGDAVDGTIMFSRGATALGGSAGTIFGTNPIKTYVDGVEMADPRYLSHIDPKSIERIEILAGPQASTIYGSNAINGVMQIFTKRGATSTPQLTLNLLSGWVQSNFSSALTGQHDYNAQLSGIEGRISYNAGGMWNYVGPWTPVKRVLHLGSSAGARLELPSRVGPVTTDVTFRHENMHNVQGGDQGQGDVAYRAAGWYNVYNNYVGVGTGTPTTVTMTTQTLGFALTYSPAASWSHEFGVGQDATDIEFRSKPGYTSFLYLGADTTYRYNPSHSEKQSLRYTTTARVPMVAGIQATITAGADGWHSLSTYMDAYPATGLTGTISDVSYVSRTPAHNTGGFVQSQVGVLDHLFLTYGLRAEWNPAYGTEAEPHYAPRYGVSYTQDVGRVTTKVRASYGSATRPPVITQKRAQSVTRWYGLDTPLLQYYPNFDYYLANSELNPEHQQGGEGGLELYFGHRGSLVVTRYNQTVDGLIDAPKVDSIRSLVPTTSAYSNTPLDADGYGYWYQYQYLNIASIRNEGWELQGSMNTGPFTTKGTYSWTKSRSLGVTPKYLSSFSVFSYPQYQPGATFQFLAEHTWAVGVTYAQAHTTIALNVTGLGQLRNYDNAFFNKNINPNIRLTANKIRVSKVFNYISTDQGYAMADVTGSRAFSSAVEGVMQIQNLTNHYTPDYEANNAVMGRQVKAGFRIRLQ